LGGTGAAVRKYLAFNCTKQTLIASKVELADRAWLRMKGLIGRSASDFIPGNGLWIIPAEGIHTIGMSFPIDVAYLDSKDRVIRLYHQLAPMRIAAIKWKAKSVLELPAGMLLQSRTEVGDLLSILNREGSQFESEKQSTYGARRDV
jgi:uncharacterized membrane protein (UPF0127 family)